MCWLCSRYIQLICGLHTPSIRLICGQKLILKLLLYGYHICFHMVTNISIFGRISGVCQPYVSRMSAVCRLYVSHISAGRMSAVYQPYIRRKSTVCQPSVSHISAACQPHIRRMSAVCQPYTADIRPYLISQFAVQAIRINLNFVCVEANLQEVRDPLNKS